MLRYRRPGSDAVLDPAERSHDQVLAFDGVAGGTRVAGGGGAGRGGGRRRPEDRRRPDAGWSSSDGVGLVVGAAADRDVHLRGEQRGRQRDAGGEYLVADGAAGTTTTTDGRRRQLARRPSRPSAGPTARRGAFACGQLHDGDRGGVVAGEEEAGRGGLGEAVLRGRAGLRRGGHARRDAAHRSGARRRVRAPSRRPPSPPTAAVAARPPRHRPAGSDHRSGPRTAAALRPDRRPSAGRLDVPPQRVPATRLDRPNDSVRQ